MFSLALLPELEEGATVGDNRVGRGAEHRVNMSRQGRKRFLKQSCEGLSRQNVRRLVELMRLRNKHKFDDNSKLDIWRHNELMIPLKKRKLADDLLLKGRLSNGKRLLETRVISWAMRKRTEIERRCRIIQGVEREAVQKIERVLHDNNPVVRAASEQIIARDIVLQVRDGTLSRGADTHTFYDALEYPLGNVNIGPRDQVQTFRAGRYVSSKEAAWRLLSLPLHERHPTVTYLVVNLSNGERIYFTEQNFSERIATSPRRTLTAFFSFTKTIPSLKHCSMPKFLATIRGTCPGRNESPMFKRLLSRTGQARGRTAHSIDKLLLNLATETPKCNIIKSSSHGALLQHCKLIVWDECTMSHKRAVEALNRSLQVIRGNRALMGGVVSLLAGDFRQTLPVIERGTPADEMNACLKASPLWAMVEKLHLITNMRVHLYNDLESDAYAHQLLEVGEGRLEKDAREMIEFANNFCNVVSLEEELIANDATTYCSIDTVMSMLTDDSTTYPVEFFELLRVIRGAIPQTRAKGFTELLKYILIYPTTHCYLRLPITICDYLRQLATTRNNLRLPATTCDNLRLPATTRDYLRLPVTTCD
ncbi:hypothetical protein PR048_005192 [Dryococelus australis]|uniref:ATP-dependent DNA helicase n=1 Tax=Dryococelus australis TaxID=614101 RepID=A0ABQ9I8E3_9NEOP|nr:hypothetical protein PR048_005192 [Dryococelus australis]